MSKGVKDKLLGILKIFHKLHIEVLPNYNVKEGKNSKRDFTPIDGWKDKPYSYKENIKAVEDGIIGFIVKSGKKSNISVVDYDFHGKETTNTTDILNRLKATSTFYITTPTGGYHFYFKYHKGILKNSRGIFDNIDLRNDGGLLFLGIRDDGEYEIHYEDALIKTMPKDIFTELNEWKKATTRDEDIKEHTFKETFLKNTERYNITEKQLFKYLCDLPNEYLDNNEEWKTITFILKNMVIKMYGINGANNQLNMIKRKIGKYGLIHH